MRPLLLLLALGGCDLVFGLDSITPVSDAQPPANLVQGRFVERVVSNNAMFEPMVIEQPFARGALALSAVLDDGTPSVVDLHDDGTFSFALAHAGQSYRLFEGLPGGTSELQSDKPQLSFAAAYAGRPDARPIADSYLQFGFPSTGATSGAFVFTTGQYSQSGTGQLGPVVTWDWRNATGIGAVPLGMLDASANDHVYALQLDTTRPIGDGTTFTIINAISEGSPSLEAGKISPFPAVQGVAPNECFSFRTLNATEYGRIVGGSLPRTYTPYSDWFLYWAPSVDQLGATGAIWFAYWSVPIATDLALMPSAYQPFPGGSLLLSAAAYAEFDVHVGTAMPLLLANSTRRYQKITGDSSGACAAPNVDIPGSVALAGNMFLDSMPLAAANQTLPLDASHDHTLTFALSAGAVTLLVAQLFELVAVNNDTTAVFRKSISITAPSALFDRTLFESGHTYVIAVVAQIGRPNTQAGDFATVAAPLETSNMWSEPFVVQ